MTVAVPALGEAPTPPHRKRGVWQRRASAVSSRSAFATTVHSGVDARRRDLRRWCSRAHDRGRRRPGPRAIATPTFFAGAVVFADLGTDEPRLSEVSAALKRAGFATVRGVRRAAPPELSAAAPVLTPATSVAKLPSVPPPARGSDRRGVPPRKVEVLTVGLHVARPLGLEPHRSRLLRAFEKEFGAFERCHGLASPHAQNASFGVDLLVPAGGGGPRCAKPEHV